MSQTISHVSQESACLGECLQKLHTNPHWQTKDGNPVAKEDTINPIDQDTEMPAPSKALEPAMEESTEARIERLGRERPGVFSTIWAEIGFIFSIAMSQILAVSSHALCK